MKINIMVAGAGKVGRLVYYLLSHCGDYSVHLVDAQTGKDPEVIQLDIRDAHAMTAYIKQHQIVAVVSCLPYFLNVDLAKIALQTQIHYFDLTEDVHVTEEVK